MSTTTAFLHDPPPQAATPCSRKGCLNSQAFMGIFNLKEINSPITRDLFLIYNPASNAVMLESKASSAKLSSARVVVKGGVTMVQLNLPKV
jgi:hypothetical protein